MTPPLRDNGSPSPFETGTHDAAGLPPAIAFDPAMADGLRLGVEVPGGLDMLDLGPGAPAWMTALARSIRPLCVGALMAIPTAGAASVGLVAMVSPRAAAAMVAASTAFLAGIPTDIVVLIGTLASGYGLAKSVERLRGVR
ncbi:hypothetical protein [Sphingomonas sp. SORGH_AS_0879]|uniref:hypothetical protein n=1 Tax=Sphingomonas sp. SORGH_AS_0879 TaxID=3041790 RepID=UPI00278727D6|nr:hypothetical protein [Sphingomonas sp. SORGH_AS_0879]MDQ1229261.1 hypothetical protein [Sphingomonas sp. SORGH_AS_0879]